MVDVDSKCSPMVLPKTPLPVKKELVTHSEISASNTAPDTLFCNYPSLLNVDDSATLAYDCNPTGAAPTSSPVSKKRLVTNKMQHEKENGENGVINPVHSDANKVLGESIPSRRVTNGRNGRGRSETGQIVEGTSSARGGNSQPKRRLMQNRDEKSLDSPTTEETAQTEESRKRAASRNSSKNDTLLFDRYGFVIGKSKDANERSGSIDSFRIDSSSGEEKDESISLPSSTSRFSHTRANKFDRERAREPKETSRRTSGSGSTDDNRALQQRRGANIPGHVRKMRINIEHRREKKWTKMMKSWDRLHSEEKKKNKAILRRRVRKGIPNSYRGTVWLMLADVPTKTRANPGRYQQLARGAVVPTDTRDTIERDIHRTFPRHYMFLEDQSDNESQSSEQSNKEGDVANDGGSRKGRTDKMEAKGGQASLRRVLNAYSMYDRDVGYCQGMNFIAATFITYMPEEEAFWLLVAVMKERPCKMRGLFGEGMHEAQQILFVSEKLIGKFFPYLSRHFEKENVHITMFATQWLLTVYTSSFPFDLVARVWDCFISEGWKIVYRVMLALLQLAMPDLMRMQFEEILAYFSRLPSRVDGAAIMEAAYKVPLRWRHIAMFEEEYLRKNRLRRQR